MARIHGRLGLANGTGRHFTQRRQARGHRTCPTGDLRQAFGTAGQGSTALPMHSHAMVGAGTLSPTPPGPVQVPLRPPHPRPHCAPAPRGLRVPRVRQVAVTQPWLRRERAEPSTARCSGPLPGHPGLRGWPNTRAAPRSRTRHDPLHDSGHLCAGRSSFGQWHHRHQAVRPSSEHRMPRAT